MSNDVFANGNAVSCKAGDGKVIAAFPDVCMSPPSPPAGPIPVPYPDTSFSKDMKNGSKKVKINQKEVMLKDKSFFATSPLGNEAATRTFGAGVVSHVITGKTYFAAWSMDVKFEGMNVPRHLDLTTSNHASPMGDTPPLVEAEKLNTDEPQCPCCKAKPPHENQIDPDTGKMYEPIKESDFYDNTVARMDAKVASMNAAIATKPEIVTTMATQIAGTLDQQRKVNEAREKVRKAREQKPPCENLHDPADSGCGVHLNKTNPEPKTSDKKVRARLGFTDGVRNESIKRYRDMGRTVPKNASVSHKTPLSAGGCPSSQNNLIPKEAMSKECQEVDDAQTLLQSPFK